MASHGGGHVAGYTPAKTNEGWGTALLVCALAVALWIMAWMIHRNTYQDPMDPLARPGQPPAAAAPAAGGH